MEPSVTDRIPPPAWAGRPQLLRVRGERYVAAATLSVVGLAAGAGAVVLAQDRLLALIAVLAVGGGVGPVAARIGVSRLRAAATEAPAADERPSRPVDRVDYVIATASWQRMGALLALLPLDHSVGAVDPIGRPVVVGAAGLLIGLGIGAWACARWVRRWERRECKTLYQHDVRVDPTPPPPGTGGALTPEETARVQRRLMCGQGLDAGDRERLARIQAQRAAEKGRRPDDATSRHYVVVPGPGRSR